uniref:CHK kinase-like domain-containing protein n=1 Tax=Odontella aurita TaxID=265563 RepID=A0A7S4K565_9STRA|mmetsp:Transcript_61219/g.181050  ORF Transcript_61219/g.181050 Transcript_61219/m.181050 type:complete len:403 (+) Transcript_61219:95-1303(+)
MPRKRRGRRAPEGKDSDSFDEDSLLRLLPDIDGVESISSESDLQQLWAGYGSVRAFTAVVHRRDSSSPGSEEESVNLIVKRVRPPPDDGTSVSHARKIRSYEIEANFYSKYAPRVRSSSGAECALPSAYHVESSSSSSSSDPSPSFTFLLSDLRSDFPVPDPYRMDGKRTEAALRWLAAFHAVFWEDDEGAALGDDDEPSSSLWECGGYWHLDTRREELERVSNREWGRLKAGASVIDGRMRRSAEFRTVCHGDFKSANLLFRSDGSECAAVDYQYVGGGFGMKDVVMLLVSSVDSGTMCHGKRERVLELLRYYREALAENLRSIGRVPADRVAAYSFDAAVQHYELCLMDYVRFMAGWGFWGENCRYAQDECRRIIEDMEEGGADLRTEQGWIDALQKRYP